MSKLIMGSWLLTLTSYYELPDKQAIIYELCAFFAIHRFEIALGFYQLYYADMDASN